MTSSSLTTSEQSDRHFYSNASLTPVQPITHISVPHSWSRVFGSAVILSTDMYKWRYQANVFVCVSAWISAEQASHWSVKRFTCLPCTSCFWNKKCIGTCKSKNADKGVTSAWPHNVTHPTAPLAYNLMVETQNPSHSSLRYYFTLTSHSSTVVGVCCHLFLNKTS